MESFAPMSALQPGAHFHVYYLTAFDTTALAVLDLLNIVFVCKGKGKSGDFLIEPEFTKP